MMNDTVQLYSFHYKIGDLYYGGHIPALSWEDAARKVSYFGGIIDGILDSEFVLGNICAVCSEQVTRDLTSPQPLAEDDWEDIIQ